MRISDWSSDVCSADLAPVKALALRGGVFLDEEAPIVAHLIEPIGDMLGQRGGAILEHQPNAGAVDRPCIETGRARGDRAIEAVVREGTVAQLEPARARVAGAH